MGGNNLPLPGWEHLPERLQPKSPVSNEFGTALRLEWRERHPNWLFPLDPARLSDSTPEGISAAPYLAPRPCFEVYAQWCFGGEWAGLTLPTVIRLALDAFEGELIGFREDALEPESALSR